MVRRARHVRNTPDGGRLQGMTWLALAVGITAAVGVGVAVFAGRHDDRAGTAPTADRTNAAPQTGSWPVVEVYKSATCGCCSKWVEHLQTHGFTVRTTDSDDVNAIKTQHRVPRQVQSCHTARVDGYVLEGHVPAVDVQRLLKERPAIAGLAVAGMPIGSPGMEVPGVKAHRYDVIAFDKNGGTRAFAAHE
jgi:hypothetical protein